MKRAYIVAAKRSAIGSFMGSLSQMNPAEFGTQVLAQMLKEKRVNPEWIDEVIIGNVLQAGLKQGIARQISIGAKIPVTTPAYTVNMICGSGMKSILTAYTNIQAGFNDLIVAGGIEAMSNAPYLVSAKIRSGVKMGNFELVDTLLSDALTDVFNNYHMGITAENVASKYQISRVSQEEFAFASQVKAINAQNKGLFDKEIAPVVIKTKKDEVIFNKDEYINRTTTLEKMAKLRPAFKSDGSVTAATSSGINDGVSFVLVASEEAVKKYKLKPLVEIVSVGQGGVDPSFMGLGPTPAIIHALKNGSIAFNEIDLIELNEAFAAQSIGVIKQLSEEFKVDYEQIIAKTNQKGGAIALGHPLGASGNRIVVTLIYSLLESKKANYGLASLCIGGGMGTAIILKKV